MGFLITVPKTNIQLFVKIITNAGDKASAIVDFLQSQGIPYIQRDNVDGLYRMIHQCNQTALSWLGNTLELFTNSSQETQESIDLSQEICQAVTDQVNTRGYIAFIILALFVIFYGSLYLCKLKNMNNTQPVSWYPAPPGDNQVVDACKSGFIRLFNCIKGSSRHSQLRDSADESSDDELIEMEELNSHQQV